jgi:Mn2+/Fe2+ NRAMP family transporter
MCDALDWKSGLDEKFHGARRFYIVIAVSTLIGMVITFLKIPAVTALFWTAVINGVLAPPLIVLIMLVSNSKKVMKDRTNGPLTNILGWATAVIMTAAATAMFVTWGK